MIPHLDPDLHALGDRPSSPAARLFRKPASEKEAELDTALRKAGEVMHINPESVPFCRKNLRAAEAQLTRLEAAMSRHGEDSNIPDPILREWARLKKRVEMRQAELETAQRRGKRALQFR